MSGVGTVRETLGACSSVCCSGKTSSRLLHPAASLGLSVENTTWETESNFVRRVVSESCFCFVVKFAVLRTMPSCCALGAVQVIWKEFTQRRLFFVFFSSEFPLSPRGRFLGVFSTDIILFLPLLPCPRCSEVILQCATVAARETWTRVGGLYFGLSGSVVRDLCVFRG